MSEHITPVPSVVYVQGPARKRTRHGLHLILTVLTGGLWGLVWVYRILVNRNV